MRLKIFPWLTKIAKIKIFVFCGFRVSVANVRQAKNNIFILEKPVLQKMRYIGNTLDLVKIKEFAKIHS
jgi:hypothetical protein